MKTLIKAVTKAFLDKAIKVPFFEKDVLKYKNLPHPRDIGVGIPKDTEGVYVLKLGRKCIYVGEGEIKTRLKSHYSKASGAADTYPDGWLAFQGRLNMKQKFKDLKRKGKKNKIPLPENERREFLERFECENWKVYYQKITSQAMRTAIEGCLIATLNPKANSETYENHD
jgi:hypothetical protein